jgi:hypothetical protein
VEDKMNVKRILTAILCLSLVLPLVGCGQDYGQYAQAVKEQNITRQLRMETAVREREYLQKQHELKMAQITGSLVLAAAKTDSPNDDMMVPMVIMMMEDKWAMANMAARASEPKDQMATIEAPETIGETIQKSTGLLLGAGAIWLGITQSNNMESIATSGMNAAGATNTINGDGNTLTSDSYKAGTDNINTGGDIGGVVNGLTSGGEPVEPVDDEWYTPGCSTTSHAEGKC